MPFDCRPNRVTTLVMVILAALAIELGLQEPGQPLVATLATAVPPVLLMIGAHLLVSRWHQKTGLEPTPGGVATASDTSSLTPAVPYRGLTTLVVLGALLLPLPMEAIGRAVFHRGWPLEAILLASFRNLLLVAGVLASHWLFRNIAAGMSAFAFLFALSVGQEQYALMTVLFGLFVAASCLWLLLRYWSGFAGDEPGMLTRLPWIPLLAITAIVMLTWTLAELGPRETRRLAYELVPSSGGTSRADRWARGGVGDGDDLVSGDNPDSDGGTGNSFIESHLPTFYDVVNEQLGEPYKPKHLNRAVSLSGNQVKRGHDHAHHHRAGRQFSLYRRKRKSSSRPQDLQADALFYVQGPVPLHLRLQAFTTFDGECWHERQGPQVVDAILEGRWHWLTIPRARSEYFGARVWHKLKLGKIGGARLPTPAHLTAFRIGLASRSDFYDWVQPDVLGLRDRGGRLPPGELFETESLTVRRDRLADVASAGHSLVVAMCPLYRSLPDDFDRAGEIGALAQCWAGHLPPGWPRVEAIVERLRCEYTFDRDASSPDDRDALRWFLLESKAGTAYHFASAATALLRMLEVPTRMVSGFYANPKRHDARTRFTPVLAEDLHFWVEILMPDGEWVTVEPTPGFEPLPTSLTWGQALVAALVEAGCWMASHPLTVAAWGVLLTSLWWYRRELLALLVWMIWYVVARRSAQRCLIWTAWLLDRRARLAGVTRPRSRTVRRWYERVAAQTSTLQSPGSGQFFDCLEQLQYCSQGLPEERVTLASQACLEIARQWTPARLRQAGTVLSDRNRPEPAWKGMHR